MKIHRIKYLMFNYVIYMIEYLTQILMHYKLIGWYSDHLCEKVDFDIFMKIAENTSRYTLCILFIVIAYFGKFIRFQRKNFKRNAVSILKIFISFMFFNLGWATAWANIAAACENSELTKYLSEEMDVKSRLILCVLCIIYIIWGEKIHRMLHSLKQKIFKGDV